MKKVDNTKRVNTIKKIKIYIDEAGRGPLAGPLHVGVVLPVKRFVKKDFQDSKSITEKIREELFSKIEKLTQKGSIFSAIWIVTAQEIDELKVTKAINTAIRRALLEIFREIFHKGLDSWEMKCSCDVIDRLALENLLQDPSEQERPLLIEKIQNFVWKIELVIDGKHDFWLWKDLWIATKTIVKGDLKNNYIAMASILAKVSRDRFVVDVLDLEFPEYGFAQHKGYGTKQHRENIKKYWPCKYHRTLFLRNLQ